MRKHKTKQGFLILGFLVASGIVHAQEAAPETSDGKALNSLNALECIHDPNAANNAGDKPTRYYGLPPNYGIHLTAITVDGKEVIEKPAPSENAQTGFPFRCIEAE